MDNKCYFLIKLDNSYEKYNNLGDAIRCLQMSIIADGEYEIMQRYPDTGHYCVDIRVTKTNGQLDINAIGVSVYDGNVLL